jgi:hypothetical protein
MVPTLAEGQAIAVDFSIREPRRGELLVFRQNEQLIVHRCLGRARSRTADGQRAWRTRGDGWNRLDPALDPARVLGRVVAVQDGTAWRSLSGRAPAFYAALLVWHDLGWALAGTMARLADRAARRLVRRAPFQRRVEALDRRLLGIVHRNLFRRVHPLTTAPAGAEPAATAD